MTNDHNTKPMDAPGLGRYSVDYDYKIEATQALANATAELASMIELLAARELEIKQLRTENRQLEARLTEFVMKARGGR